MRSLFKFLSFTYLVSWVLWITASVILRGSAPNSYGLLAIGGFLYLLGVFAPSLVALALIARTDGRAGTLLLLRRTVKWSVGSRWYVFAVVYMAAVKRGHLTCAAAPPGCQPACTGVEKSAPRPSVSITNSRSPTSCPSQAKFLQRYYRYDAQIKDRKLLRLIRDSGLEEDVRHLTGMCAALESEDALTLNQMVQRWLSLNPKVTKPANLPEQRGNLTIDYVHSASDADEHIKRVREWARDVWVAWSEHHNLARQLIGAAAINKSH
ncbi:MAG: DUF5946 family protein [Pyrinomonadaceae bacterium]